MTHTEEPLFRSRICGEKVRTLGQFIEGKGYQQVNYSEMKAGDATLQLVNAMIQIP